MAKIIQPYLSMNRNKFFIYAVPAPPQFLAVEYNEIRKETTLRILAERMDPINNPT